jgi:hypothetical protein
MPSREPLSNRSRPMFGGCVCCVRTCQSAFSRDPGAKSGLLTARIYNHFALPLASRAVSQVVNGCAAHDWGQVLVFEGKSCSHLGAFTTSELPHGESLPRCAPGDGVPIQQDA